jgi:hypothetical protein
MTDPIGLEKVQTSQGTGRGLLGVAFLAFVRDRSKARLGGARPRRGASVSDDEPLVAAQVYQG